MTTSRPTSGDDIRSAFTRFFEERGHLAMPSASLIPAGDPTLLLTTAGMVPFKPYFSGDETPPSRRLTSCQKCFRTTDIDSVGDRTHHTMFEMLGNFSVGDYFKRDAINWAWEFLTEVMRLPPERLWVTVHTTDDEAEAIWHREVGVPMSRIVRLGDKDNFWGPAGSEGPCGPSSELHWDWGEEHGPGMRVGDETDRFTEIWNLVFVQFHQHPDKRRAPLPAPSIDTGMGLERLTSVVYHLEGRGKRPSAYETDLLSPVVRVAEEIAGVPYGEGEETDFALRVMAEHARSATFLIGDGVVPSNEGRGYVLRRVIRRGIRFSRKIGVDKPFMARLSEAVVERFGARYPELAAHRRFILRALEREEEAFSRVVSQGLQVFGDFLGRKAPGVDIVDGGTAFLLYDSYGFPLEMTQELAREHGLDVDVAGFEAEMAAQRERGRASGKFGGGREAQRKYEQLGVEETAFLGYERLEADTVVLGMWKDGIPAQEARAGDSVEVVLRETPFYAEGGGQVGDTGELRGPAGTVRVTDTQRPAADVIVHIGKVAEGLLSTGDTVRARVDAERRADIMRNHTATHLLHAVLRRVLGTHVRQAGSLVAPDRLRFDFTHVAPLTRQEIVEIERQVNDAVLRDLPVVKREGSYRDAVALGALAFFGERYGENVRTVQVGEETPFSFELCGGTHLNRSGEIGMFRIVGESSVGTGMRRIEAVTGRGTESWVNQRLELLEAVAAKLNVPPAEAPSRVDALMAEVERSRKAAEASQRDIARKEAEALLERAVAVNGFRLVAARSKATTADAMREMGDWLRDKLGSGVVVLGGVFNERPSVIAMVTPDLVAKGLKASDIVRAAARQMGGGGGGRPDVAQAGGREPSQLQAALDAAAAAVRVKEG
ncbi:MAG: alanine--tRNA ligase [SAR202 cluster bacterium]|nr:alanine--tRNA ligase [SAR202 cluster bacterium]